MPDLSPLPPLGDTPSFAPDPARFERTARAARRRRAVRTSLPAGAAAVAVVAAFVTTGATSSNSLRPLTTPPPSASGSPGTASPEPTEAPGPSATAAGPGATAQPGGPPATATGEPGGGPAPTGGPSATPEPSGEPTASSTPRAVFVSPQPVDGRPYPPYRRARLQHVPMGTAACGGTYGGTADPWCARYLGPRTVTAGERYDFAFELCRATTDGGLAYADAGELLWAFTDADGGRAADSGGWSSDPSAKAHQIPVAAGTCARWTATWTVPGGIRAGMYGLEWMNGWSEVRMVSPEQRTVTVQSAP